MKLSVLTIAQAIAVGRQHQPFSVAVKADILRAALAYLRTQSIADREAWWRQEMGVVKNPAKYARTEGRHA